MSTGERNDGEHVVQAPPILRPDAQEGGAPDGMGVVESYNAVAETVGFMPSMRVRDNVLQIVFVVAVTGVCALVGWYSTGQSGATAWTMPRQTGALIAGVIGLIASTFLSGLVLMVLGFVRALRRRGDRPRRG